MDSDALPDDKEKKEWIIMTQLLTKLENKKKRFIDTLNFLKNKQIKTPNGKEKKLADSPWTIMLGPAGSGKTSLLSQSEVHFNLSKKTLSTDHHQDPNWWVNKQGIILDLPGRLLASKAEEKQLYLNLIRKYAYKKHCSSIVLVISLRSLLFDSPQQQHRQLKQSLEFISALEAKFKQPIPVYLVINQMDAIEGFSAFFSSLAKEERQQIWGISFTNQNNDALTQFPAEFDELTNRLYFQLISRLHYEPNYLQRFFVSLFPNEFASLKGSLKKLLMQTQKIHPNIHWRGIYFTSVGNQAAQMKGEKEQQSVTSHRVQAKPFFINQLVQKIILISQHEKRSNRILNQFNWKPTIAFISTGLILALLILFLIQHKLNLTSTIAELQNTTNANEKDGSSLTASIEKIVQLSNVEQRFTARHWWQPWLPSNEHQKVDVTLNNQVNKIIQSDLLPSIKQALEQTIQDNNASDLIKIACIKSYFMLSKPSTLDTTYLVNTLQAIIPNTLNSSDTRQKFIGILSNLKPNDFAKLSVNYPLLASAQQFIASIPQNRLAYLLFQSNFINLPTLTINFSTNHDANMVFQLTNPHLGIFALYTPAYWQTIQKQLPNLTNRVEQDLTLLTNQTQNDSPNLSNFLWQSYQDNYANVWLQFIKNITLKKADNFSDLMDQLALLTKNQSVLIQLSQLLQQQIPASVLTENSELQQDMQLLSSNSTFGQKISNLYQELNPLNSDVDIFNATKQRILNNGRGDSISDLFSIADQLPAPFNDWSIQFAQQSWRLMLNSTQQYIQDQWHSRIWPSFDNEIFNRYPFNQQASFNVSLKQFINLFAYEGLLDQFFTSYISPFLNMQQTPWQPISLNGMSLALSQNILDQFYQVRQLRDQYFTLGNQHLFIPFTLQITQFSQSLAQVSITLGAQQITYTANQKPDHVAFSWPDSQNDQAMTIQLMDKNNQTSTVTYPDSWGPWQLIQNSRVIAQPDPQHVLYEYDDGTLAFRYLMGFQTNSNPFTLNTFNNINLPETLFHDN